MYLNSIYVKRASCHIPTYTTPVNNRDKERKKITSIKGSAIYLLSLLLQFLDEVDKENKFQTNVVDCDPYGRTSRELGEIMLALESTSVAPEEGDSSSFSSIMTVKN